MIILIYYPYNQRSVEQQSVMKMLRAKEHNVHLLTTCEEGYIHKYVRQFGVVASASPVKGQSGFLNYFRQAWYFYSYCRKNKIKLVFAQQQSAALPALIASFFLRLRIAYFRHNSDEDYQAHSIKAKWMNYLLNHSFKIMVAPSQKVAQHWINEEKVSPNKIMRIDYGYDFEQYEKANEAEIKSIQGQYPTQFRIISIARLVPAKRHLLMFQSVAAAIAAGVECKLICIGTGPDESRLKQWVVDNHLEEYIFIIGYRANIFDYLGASDLYLHLSSTEASNSSVKEAGLSACPCIVCRGVGDFEDYITNEQNGFLVNQRPDIGEVASIIGRVSKDKPALKETGKRLKATVLKQFDINNVSGEYDKLLRKMSQ